MTGHYTVDAPQGPATVAVRLTDPLGRPVTVFRGNAEAPELALPDGRRQPPTTIWGATGRMTRQLLELSATD